MKKLKINSKRAKNAEILLWICAGLYILSFFSNLMEYFLLNEVQKGVYVTIEQFQADTKRQIIISLCQFVALIVSAITFILWFRRAYFNQEVKFEYMYSKNVWTGISFLIPIYSLFKPFQLMKEIHQNMDEHFVKNGLGETNQYFMKRVFWWWFLWIILNSSQYVANLVLLKSAFPERLMKVSMTFMTIDILFIFLCYLTIKMIRNYNQLELLIIENSDNVENKADKYSDLLDSHF